MSGSISGVIVALLAFGLTFAVVKVVAGIVRKRRAGRARQEALQNQSRQVRRAESRRRKV